METKLRHISISYLEKITEGDKEIAIKILNLFIVQVGENIENLLIALHDNNFQKIKFYAHKAKNDLNIIGMDSLAEQMKELEILAKKELPSKRYAEIISIYIKESQLAIDDINEYLNENLNS